jgi:hypothetical protein
MQVCAMPAAYWEAHKHCMDWAAASECKTIVCREDANSHRMESVLHCKAGGFVEANGFVTFPSRLNEATSPNIASAPGTSF